MLAAEQINLITDYCEKKGVVYYDVQLELVDHIAGMIEHLKHEKAELNFEEALEIAGGQFSETEFNMIVQNKKEQLLSRFVRLWKKEFYGYFTFPKIAFTLALVAATAFVYTRLTHVEQFSSLAVHCFNIINFGYVFGRSETANQIKKERHMPLLVFNVLKRKHVLLIIPSLFYLLLSLLNLFHFGSFYGWLCQTATCLFPLLFLICLAWRKMYVDQLLLIRQNYPKVFCA